MLLLDRYSQSFLQPVIWDQILTSAYLTAQLLKEASTLNYLKCVYFEIFVASMVGQHVASLRSVLHVPPNEGFL